MDAPMAEGIIKGMEGAHAEMVQWTLDMDKALKEEIGPRPFGLDSVPERTQIRHGALIWDNEQAWQTLLQTHGWKPGGPIPKAVIKYGEQLVRLKAKFPEEFKAGQKGEQGSQLLANGLVPPEENDVQTS